MSVPAPLSADLRQAITADFATYRAMAAVAVSITPTIERADPYSQGRQLVGNPLYVNAVTKAMRSIPAWYTGAFTNVSQGANGNTGYVSLRLLKRNGVTIWEVPYQYKLNEGTQTITPQMASLANGWLKPDGNLQQQNMISLTRLLFASWFFTDDPRPYLPVGVIGGGYVGGISGRAITREAATGIAIVVGAVVGGAALGGAFAAGGGAIEGAGAAEAGTASAGIDLSADIPAFSNVAASTATSTAVADADLYAVAAGAEAVTTGAPVVAASSTGFFGNVATVLGTVGSKLETAAIGLAATTGVQAAAKAAGLAPKKQIQGNTAKTVSGSGSGGGAPTYIIEQGAPAQSNTSAFIIAVVSGIVVILLAKVFL